jgi:hypothetical protein
VIGAPPYFYHPFQIAALAGAHAFFPERAVATVALSHAAPFCW